jgi:transcriptional regulator with XRE-family HTH domain
MSDQAPPDDGATLKARRKALGWARRELADRAGIDPRVIQLLELDQWHEGEASGRVQAVLMRAESGETDVRLPPIEVPEDAHLHTLGGGPVAEA